MFLILQAVLSLGDKAPAFTLIGDKGYDRCVHTFLSAIKIACTVIFWFNQIDSEPSYLLDFEPSYLHEYFIALRMLLDRMIC